MKGPQEIIDEIILLGRENDWFIDFLPFSDETDYITFKGNIIYIDTNCIKIFLDSNKENTDDELEEFLREMIEVNIPDSINYQFIIKINNLFL